MDARRSSDNALVLLKKINLSRCPREVEILRRFLSKSSADNPENHCVPVYDVLEVPESTDLAILVMPYLLQTHSPDFETLGEIVEYFRQIFEVVFSPNNHVCQLCVGPVFPSSPRCSSSFHQVESCSHGCRPLVP